MQKEILLLGEFSTGKSALINILLGVSIIPERLESTDLPIIKISGQKPTGLFLFEKNQKNPKPLDSFNMIPKDWSDFDYVALNIPNHPLLQEGLVIWDTPGINSINVYHTKHLETFLKNHLTSFRMVLFLLHSSLTQSSIEFLNKNKQLFSNIQFVINLKENKTFQECKTLKKEAEKSINKIWGSYNVDLLMIGDICEEFNILSEKARENCSDWELIKEWDKRKIDISSLRNNFKDNIIWSPILDNIIELSKVPYDELNDIIEALKVNSTKEPEEVIRTRAKALAGNVNAQYILAKYLFYIKNYKESFNWLLKTCLNDNHEAFTDLGIFYSKGIGTEIDKELAFLWFTKAHNFNIEKGTYYYARCLLYGEGCEKNIKEAFFLLNSLEKKGNTDCLKDLGYCYYHNLGIPFYKKIKVVFGYDNWLKLKIFFGKNIANFYGYNQNVEVNKKISNNNIAKPFLKISFALVLIAFLVIILANNLSFFDQKSDQIYVEGGFFSMGNNNGEKDEAPEHEIFLNSFYIDKYPVTVAEYRKYCAENNLTMPEPPSWGWIDNHPMVNITYEEAKAYAKWVNKRLPTEAEWEYAASGGKKSLNYKYSGGNVIETIGWYKFNSQDRTAPVGKKLPNELGIYDMSGNVFEYCIDYYKPDFYSYSPKENPVNLDESDFVVIRGGSWKNLEFSCRITNRSGVRHKYGFDYVGFRCVKDIK